MLLHEDASNSNTHFSSRFVFTDDNCSESSDISTLHNSLIFHSSKFSKLLNLK